MAKRAHAYTFFHVLALDSLANIRDVSYQETWRPNHGLITLNPFAINYNCSLSTLKAERRVRMRAHPIDVRWDYNVLFWDMASVYNVYLSLHLSYLIYLFIAWLLPHNAREFVSAESSQSSCPDNGQVLYTELQGRLSLLAMSINVGILL